MSVGRLHILTDEVLQSRFSAATLAGLAHEGGADIVQYREKRERTQEQRCTAVTACMNAHPRIIVNDSLDVVRFTGAAGVHLGPSDASVADARGLLASGSCIGLTVNSLDALLGLEDADVAYLGVGPVYITTSKANAPEAIGLEGLAAIVRASPVPVIAIGGLLPEHVGDVLDTGAYGLAVLAGVVCQPDPAAATRAYRVEIDRWLHDG